MNSLLVAGTTGALLLAGADEPLALGVGVGVGVAVGLALTRRGPVTALLYDSGDETEATPAGPESAADLDEERDDDGRP